MKRKILVAAICTTSILLTGCASKQPKDAQSMPEKVAQVFAKHVDTYTTASKTKRFLEIQDVADTLKMVSSDLASQEEAMAEGYEKPKKSVAAQVLSVNPDGCPGAAAISAWKYEQGEDGSHRIAAQLTDGQTAQNLKEIGARGTFVVVAEVPYLVHVQTADLNILEYSKEAYDAGEFSVHYSGVKDQAAQYNFIFDVISVEQSS